MTDEFTEKFTAKFTLKIHYKIHYTEFTFPNSLFLIPFFEIDFSKLTS